MKIRISLEENDLEDTDLRGHLGSHNEHCGTDAEFGSVSLEMQDPWVDDKAQRRSHVSCLERSLNVFHPGSGTF